MVTPPPAIVTLIYCARCTTDRPRSEFRTVMAHVPAGFTRKAPALVVLKHVVCKQLVYMPAMMRADRRIA